MFLEGLILENYRNYEHTHIDIDRKINFIIGNNAQGKTNILEAIYMLALSKSHRSNKEEEIIKWGQEKAQIIGQINIHDRPMELKVSIYQKGKKVEINQIEQKKISSFVGQAKAVLFAPEDLFLIKGSPQQRRRFIDMGLSQVKVRYMSELINYQKVLRQRNQYLKDAGKCYCPLPKDRVEKDQVKDMLEIWDMQLVEYGRAIIEMRSSYIEEISKLAERQQENMTAGQEKLEIIYEPSVTAEKFADKLRENQTRDLFAGSTSYGPHRDDISFYINGKDAKIYGSQGQQRTVALAIKLAELEYMSQKIQDSPLLLLDDVLSELDQDRQKQLLDSIDKKTQTFITATDIDSMNEDLVSEASIFRVQAGKIVKEN